MKKYTKEEIARLVAEVSAEVQLRSKDEYLEHLKMAEAQGVDMDNAVIRESLAVLVAQQCSATVLARVLAEILAED